MSLHVVVGSGPLGIVTARALGRAGHSVRVLSRREKPALDLVEQVVVDASDQEQLTSALAGAGVVYNCASAPYHRWEEDLPPLWRSIQGATRAVGAALVIGTNLYAYGRPSSPMREDSSFRPCSRKGRVRAVLEQEALDAHAAGDLPVAIVRGSDFYGPSVLVSALGERFFKPILRGLESRGDSRRHSSEALTATFLGSIQKAHSYTYLPDFGKTMATVGSNPDLFGSTWHVPSGTPASGEELAAEISTLTGAKVIARVTPVFALRIGGIFVPAAKEMIEMLYEFDSPFVIDSARSEEVLGISATDREAALSETIGWFRDRIRPGSARLVTPA